jgi:hypothetical protein
MPSPHVGDVGSIIRVTLVDSDRDPVDIHDATTKQLRFKKQDNTTVVKTAVFTHDGSDGQIEYEVEVGFFDQISGRLSITWEIQAYVEGPGYKYSSEVKDFPLLPNIA